MMRLRHIEVFNAVYAVGSVSGAAKFLNVTQPTASKTLMHAELRIGFKLFKRVRGRLIPTEEADILYRETKRISDQVTSLQKIVRNLVEAKRGQIRLASILALGLEHLPKAMIEFQRLYPDIHFEFQTQHYTHLLNSVLEQEKDIGVVFNAQHQRGLEYIDLSRGEFVCIYSQGEFDEHPERIKIEDIAGLPFIGIENSGPLGDLLNKMLIESDIAVNPAITSQTYHAALNLVAMGGGIAIVDEFTAISQSVSEVKCKAFDPPIPFSVQAIHRDISPPSKLVKKFLDFLKPQITSQFK